MEKPRRTGTQPDKQAKPAHCPAFNKRIALISTAVFGVIAAGIAWNTSRKDELRENQPQSQRSPEVTNPTRERAEKVKRLIPHIEKQFAELEAKIRPAVDIHIQDPYMRRSLLNPFVLLQNNTNFAERNRARLMDQIKKSESSRVPANDFRFFFYDLFSPETFAELQGAADQWNNEQSHLVPGAAYASEIRSIFLPPDFDPYSTGFLLTLYHELIHTSQCLSIEATRNQPDSPIQRYAKAGEAIKGLPGIDLLAETDAYRLQLECLNLLLSNEMAEGEIPNIEYVTLRLEGASLKNSKVYIPILRLAQAYFPHRDEDRLKEAVKAMHLQNGIIVHEYQNGQFVTHDPNR